MEYFIYKKPIVIRGKQFLDNMVEIYADNAESSRRRVGVGATSEHLFYFNSTEPEDPHSHNQKQS